jgi:hypothetical protein
MMNEMLEKWLANKLDNIHTCIPAEIEEYYGHEERKAKVKPLIKLRLSSNKLVEIPPIDDVPVVFGGSKTFNMLYPLKKGDGVLLVFSEASLGNFLNSEDEVEADEVGKFNLTDCIAIPSLWSFENCPEAPENDDDFFLTFQDFKIQVKDDDNTFLFEDKDGNKIESNDDGLLIEDKNGNKYEATASGIDIECKNGNKIEMGTTSVKINGNLEVMQ